MKFKSYFLRIQNRSFLLLLVFILPLLFSKGSFGQASFPSWPDSLFSTYYHQKVSEFKSLPKTQEDIIFLGNSITDGGLWTELFNDGRIKNRGISADITIGVINRLKEITDRKPRKIFLLIGTNDLARGWSVDSVYRNILEIVRLSHFHSPATKIYVQSLLPVNSVYGKFKSHTGNTNKILEINAALKTASTKSNFTFIDLFSAFKTDKNLMNPKFSNDGLHLMGEGYLLWKHLVYPYVYDLSAKAAILPTPSQLNWKEGAFKLYECKEILVGQSGIDNEARLLQNLLKQMGYNADVVKQTKSKTGFIALNLLSKKSGENTEAYELVVNENKIVISGATPQAIFYGIQTLRQLSRDGVMIDACEIKDAPAFAWRGYMIDVGRNYMSMDLLKQQIDVMSRYKLNVFHFHPTEDIAWRIESKLYPQLTAPENMLRNKGMYYAKAEIKELIQYCKDRHILFLPEIDMPGHSAAFRRAMKTDMQTDSGVAYVKNILKEFCENYDLPYIHIGADEVKITNQNFIPEMTKFLEGMGKKVIGWQPGGNFTNSTLRQLWMEEKLDEDDGKAIQYIDSRHLYLNHMDPLEAVVSIFNRRIGNRDKGDGTMIGATLCTWHDRAVFRDEEILNMNEVYPGMIAFAEKMYNGGGVQGWISNISDGDVKEFAQFEQKLLDHKAQYFKGIPFPYTKQFSTKWNLIGPYPNRGVVDEKFEPEINMNKPIQTNFTTMGGTIVLRHWWAPLIKGAIPNPQENTTWYASTEIWSDENTTKDFWIGFYNISRSQATDSPPVGAWDNRGSKVWVNEQIVSPPNWVRGGQKGNLEIPLIDESYESRKPTSIALKKGWNKVLIKLPVASFKGKDWQNSVKWMFTFVPVE